MAERVTIRINGDIVVLLLKDDSESLYAQCELLTRDSIDSIVWSELRKDSSEHMFFWILRKLISKLRFNGTLSFQYPTESKLSEIFFFQQMYSEL